MAIVALQYRTSVGIINYLVRASLILRYVDLTRTAVSLSEAASQSVGYWFCCFYFYSNQFTIIIWLNNKLLGSGLSLALLQPHLSWSLSAPSTAMLLSHLQQRRQNYCLSLIECKKWYCFTYATRRGSWLTGWYLVVIINFSSSVQLHNECSDNVPPPPPSKLMFLKPVNRNDDKVLSNSVSLSLIVSVWGRHLAGGREDLRYSLTHIIIHLCHCT